MTVRLLFLTTAAALAGLLAGCGGESSQHREQDADRLLARAGGLADRGALRAARDSARAALAVFDELGRDGRAGDAERVLGDLDASAASFDSALIHYRKALEQYRGQADRAATRSMLLTIADLSRQMGREEEAFAQHEEALRLAGVVHDQDGMREIARAMLPLARLLHRTETEERLLAGLMQAADSSGSREAGARVRQEAGLSALARGDAGTAVRLLVEAFGLADRGSDSLLTIGILMHLARAHEASGATREAMTTYTDALQRADRLRSARALREELLIRVGNAMLRLQRAADARRFFRAGLVSAAARGNSLVQAYALLQLSHCERAQNPDSARALALAGLQALEQAAPPAARAYGLGTQGLASLAAGNPVEALALLRAAAQASEESMRAPDPSELFPDCEQAALGAALAPWHDEAADLLLRLGRTEEAFGQALERSRWLLTRDLSRLAPAAPDDSLHGLLTRWQAAMAGRTGAEEQLSRALSGPSGRAERIPAVMEHLTRAVQESRALGSAIASRYPSFSPFAGGAPVSGPALRQRLPEGTLLLLYGTTSRTLHIFVAGQNRLAARVVSIGRSELARLCASWSTELNQLGIRADSLAPAAMVQADRAPAAETARLYDLLIRPLERELTGARALLIAPPEELPWVPLHALRRGRTAGSSLIERFPSSCVFPALLPAAPAAPTAPPVRTVLGFGHPGLSSHDVEYELRDIRAFFKDARFLFGPQALLPALFTEGADLLHLALDLHWDPRRPGNSTAALPDAKTGVLKEVPLGGLLRLSSYRGVVIYNVSGDAGTGARRLAALPLGAGAQYVILNGLASGRKGNKIFGEALYTALQAGEPLPQAYRTATLDIMRRREGITPFWSSFVLWGR